MKTLKVDERLDNTTLGLYHTSNQFNYCGVSLSCEVYPHLTFDFSTQSNNLTYLCEYSDRQEYIYNLIKELHDSGLGYRKISYYLNEKGISTHRGKTWSNSSVHSVLKRKHQRDLRIKNLRNKEYKSRYSNFKVEYLTR